MDIKRDGARRTDVSPKKVKVGEDPLWPLIKNKYEKGIEIRRPFERQWIVNLAFLAGRQFTFFNNTAHALQQLQMVKGKRRRVDNQLLPRWRRQVADLIKNDPQMSVVPNTNEDEDIKGSNVAQKALENFWRNNKMKKKMRQLAGWIYSTGNCFLDDRWNPKLGPQKVTKDGLVYLGDADCGVWSPFEIVTPASSVGDINLHTFPWIQKVKWRDLQWIEANYKKGKNVVSQSLYSPTIDIGSLMGAGGRDAEPPENGAYVIDFYMQPDNEFPKGLFATAANGVILQKDDYPYTSYNIEQFKDVDVPGVFWGKATMDEAIPLQVRWNITLNNIDEFNRLLAKGKMLAPHASRLTVTPDDTHGEIIYYNPVMGHKPEIMTLKGLPNSITMSLQTIQDSMDNLFSQHEVSRGTNKSDIRSGEMVALLQEQDSHGKIPSHMVFEESLEAVFGRVLKRIQVGYTDERMIKTVGRDSQWDITAFKGADLNNNTDVHVKTQSSLPDSRIARNNLVLKKAEMGLYGNIEDPNIRRQIMNMLDDAVVDNLYEDTRLDEANARKENQDLGGENGDQLLINSYDNHGVHLQEHNHYRKSMEYQKVKMSNPQKFAMIEKNFTLHQQQHQSFIEAQRQAMIEEQSKIKGGSN